MMYFKLHKRDILVHYHSTQQGRSTQIWHFVLHLRLHYQLFILSGPFLLGVLLSDTLDAHWVLIQFVNVHVLLFGGATAYNSFWDKDEGPVGGLQHPPGMAPWMWFASLLMQMIGLLLAIPMGSLFTGLYAFSMLLFWGYSSPWTRWKGHPFKSLGAIGISTGFNAVLMGYIAAGHQPMGPAIGLAATGVTFILLSLYPLSQVYQLDEDRRRGDQTFASVYGQEKVLSFFGRVFFAGLLLTAVSLGVIHLIPALLFGVIGVTLGWMLRRKIRAIITRPEGSYQQVMRIKYGTSLAFVAFLIVALLLKHNAYLAHTVVAEWFFG